MNPTLASKEPQAASTDVMFQAILSFLLPFFLRPALGDPGAAAMTIVDLVEAFNAATLRELDLAGQIVVLSTAAMDSIRRSAAANLADSKVLSYRSSAASFLRSAARLQKTLEVLQKARDPRRPPNRAFDHKPAPAANEKAASQHANQEINQTAKAAPAPVAPIRPKTTGPRYENPTIADPVIEKMQLDAHTAIKALQKQNASLTSVAFPAIPDPAMAAKAAAQAAMASARYNAAAPPR